MSKQRFTSVWDAIEDTPSDAANMKARAELMRAIAKYVHSSMTQAEAAKSLDVAQPRISTFPMHKPFEKQEPTTPLSEVALRLVVNFYSDAPQVVGTATVLSGNFLVTAKHVFEDIWSKRPSPSDPTFEVDAHLVAIQILPRPEPEYVIWNVLGGILCPVSDIALLQLATNPGRSHPNSTHQWTCPQVNPFAPEIGERVAAFGYRKSVVRVSKNPDGSNHIDLEDEPMISVGIVKEIHEMHRDTTLFYFALDSALIIQGQ